MGTSSVPSQEPRAPWEKVSLSPEDTEIAKQTEGIRATQRIRNAMEDFFNTKMEELGIH